MDMCVCVCIVFPHINIVCAFSSVQMKFCVSSAWSHALPATAWETLVPSFRAPSTSILIMMFFTMTISVLIKTQERAREKLGQCVLCVSVFFFMNETTSQFCWLFEMKTKDFEWRRKTLETVHSKIVYLFAGLAFPNIANIVSWTIKSDRIEHAR